MLDNPGDGPLPENRKVDLDKIAPPPDTALPEENTEWLARLYFLVHLVPVETVSSLRHQLRKWSILEPEPDPDIAEVEWLFGLYLDMHDAKFEGGESVAGTEALSNLFESRSVFHRVCPENGDAGSHVPWRGLREMLRFGGSEPRLMPVFQTQAIDTGMVDEIEELEAEPDGGGLSSLAEAHGRREQLHEKWVIRKKDFSEADREAYHDALEEVVRHRHLSAHVRLVNHARLHRLTMVVLARLADYAWLWERDLYFATLALVRLHGARPEEVFSQKELTNLKDGQIVFALREDRNRGAMPESRDKQVIKKDLRRLFGEGFPRRRQRSRHPQPTWRISTCSSPGRTSPLI